MSRVRLSKETYRDKVYGCWLGKNAGGTLGGPLERIWGEEELFDVWWYPKLEEGGIPNDDLEIQLVWLQAVKDRGIYLSARDLAEYWLDCIVYNYDEYGLNKTNLRKGLQPPVSGWYNNWFKNCMGSPIRSEIWACLAPGAPHIAARYAYQDAICDHAGGESVYGEIFNACIESAAFLMEDREKLLKIGLSMIPSESLTSKGIRTAIQSYNRGLEWKEARERVKKAVHSPVAQFSPINLGFQTIGLLYGDDFGDTMCKAVNCGWDTDCTGATAGAIWGIMNGKSRLPQKWTAPVGDRITISKGIRNLRAPADLRELTEEVCRLGEKVLVAFDVPVELCGADDFSDAEKMVTSYVDEVKKLWGIPPSRLDFDLVTVRASIVYSNGPAVLPDASNSFSLIVENVRPEPVSAKVRLRLPRGWKAEPSPEQHISLGARERSDLRFSVRASVGDIDTSNNASAEIILNERPGVLRLPLNFVGGFRWLVSDVFDGSASLDAVYAPEKDASLIGVGEGWRDVSWPENALEIEPYFRDQPGAIYLRHFLHSPESRKITLGVPNNSKMRLWLNGKVVHETLKVVSLRPNYRGDGSNYVSAVLQQGWNQVMTKILRGDKPVEAHFIVADAEWHHGMVDLVQCRFPWE